MMNSCKRFYSLDEFDWTESFKIALCRDSYTFEQYQKLANIGYSHQLTFADGTSFYFYPFAISDLHNQHHRLPLPKR